MPTKALYLIAASIGVLLVWALILSAIRKLVASSHPVAGAAVAVVFSILFVMLVPLSLGVELAATRGAAVVSTFFAYLWVQPEPATASAIQRALAVSVGYLAFTAALDANYLISIIAAAACGYLMDLAKREDNVG